VECEVICFSSDSVLALDTNWRLWEFDWDLEFPATKDWVEAARPYLRNFLTLHIPTVGVLTDAGLISRREIPTESTHCRTPTWTEEDFEQLISTLGRVGYGWLRPEGVRRELYKMAVNWNDPPTPFRFSR
jgi:hypothetical protein